MSQKTDLNISPYFDDFDADKNFYKVLFKPGYPVQARELTTLQSILQNQIESFGSHIFKEGSMVIPGSVTYDSEYFSLKIQETHLGVDITAYLKELIGKRLEGQTSGVVAVVNNYSIPPSNDVDEITLYIKYVSSGTDFQRTTFLEDENLVINENITYNNGATVINSGDTVATVLGTNPNAIGSAVGITPGVYFMRGSFVSVGVSTVILDPYANNGSYRVGLSVFEEIVTSDDDESLNDNARGFSNYAAPGADRFKISAILSKKDIDDLDDKDFIELIRIKNGEIRKLQDKSTYSIIKDYFAKRTYDESGDYAVTPFTVDVLNSLNDRISNEGIYLPSEKTDQGGTPSDDLMCVKISPGTAYVRGFDFDYAGSTIIDVDKPRDTQTVSTSLVPFEMGNLLRINNVSGTPFVGINSALNTIDLYNQRKNSTVAGTGTSIGKARIYSFSLTDATYSNAGTEWDLYLFDVQTYTELTLNQSLTSVQCPATSFVKGASSGASGYVVDAAAGSSVIKLSQTSGTFIQGESIIINESSIIPRTIKSIKAYNIQDIKSVYQDSTAVSSGLKTDFVADTVLYNFTPNNFSITDRLSINSAGIATCPGKTFLGIRSDSIIRYQKTGFTTETFNRVVSVSSDGRTMQLASVPTVANVCDGALPVGITTTEVTFSVGIADIKNAENASLYTPLNARNISSVNLSGSNLVITTQVRERTTNSVGSLTLNITDTNITDGYFETFDAERYSVFYIDGTVQQLRSDQVTVSSNGQQVVFSGLTPNQTSNVTVNVTIRKQVIKNRTKNLVRSEKLTVNKSSSGISTVISGLITSSFYGLRIEDKEISLNLPDVVNVIAVYESLDTSAPILDKLTFVSGLNLDTASILGERIIGSTSGAIAQLVTRSSSTEVEFVYLNSKQFVSGENVVFEESKITSNIQAITAGSYLNITTNYKLDKGQKDQYYDYSKIVRQTNTNAPTKQLLVIFNYYEIPSSDLGDILTVNSYNYNRFSSDIPTLPSGLRASDTLDFRPRVQRFTSTTTSPFDFSSRVFTTLQNSQVVSPGESSLLGYSFYLPRIDKVVLNKLGQFTVIKGTSSIDPKTPLNVEEAMDIATITLPAYLYNPDDAKIVLVDNRRYTMRDIGKLEDRIENLEITTSLSLLELDTKTLQIQDNFGLTRFKSGFFADDFKNTDLLDITNPDLKCDVQNDELSSTVDYWSVKPRLGLSPNLNADTSDYSQNLALLDSNVRKTGELITLNYTEIGWLEQPVATEVENVNPFNVIEYVGLVSLNPKSDEWERVIRIRIDGGTRRIATPHGPRREETTTVTNTFQEDPYVRSRNVQFYATGLKPLTQHYISLDSISSVDYVPKLIEISMVSGSFNVGEDVEGYVSSLKTIAFRTARPDHKVGNYSSPDKIYNANPYNRTIALPTAYSASSTILNVDTFSLAEESIGKYGGYIEIGTKLVGKTSGAVATVSNIRLISDTFGDILGTFFVRDPNTTPPPLVRVRTGDRVFKITANPSNVPLLPGDLRLASNAEAVYQARGTIRTETTIVTTVERYDPLAQSFTVDETGAYLSSVDVYFGSKDEVEKLQVQVRTVELGTPTLNLVNEFATVTLEPSDITVTSDASIPTRITFPSPIHLEPKKEYALVFLAPSTNNYTLWIATMGKKSINTASLPSAESVVYARQYLGGSLFRSQNGSIWTANQFQDLKFKLYKCNFTSTSGDVVFYNPPLRAGENIIQDLVDNPITSYPRKLKVGITTTSTMGSVLTIGKKVSHGTVSSPGTYGYVENIGSRISGSGNGISTTNVGTGYSSGSFSGVSLYNVTGNGSGATASITFSSAGQVSAVTIGSTGNGYVVGDVLGITTSNVVKGTGAQITVSTIDGIDTLYLTGVQGESFTSGEDLIVYDNSTAVACANTDIRGSSSVYNNLYTGNVIAVYQPNHGMHADNNVVEIKGVEPSTTPIKLTANLGISDTTISVASTAAFTTFEGISTSRGYIKVNNEIMFYDGINVGSLGISTRGAEGTSITPHYINDVAYKYELNGVSLTRINTIHDLPSTQALKDLRDFDVYHLELDRTDRGSGTSLLSFTEEKISGGSNASASQNYQFNIIRPQLSIFTPGEQTTVSSTIETVSGTSAGGSEVSFLSKEPDNITLNEENVLDSPRLMCSERNEIERLSSEKSFTLRVKMNSGDSNLSPAINIKNASIILGRSRVNNPVSNYVSDGRSNLLEGDPHASVYISKRIDLKQPATSLKLLVSAYRSADSDFRVLYRLFKSDSSEIEQSYELFPGYDNLTDTDGDGYGDTVVDSSKNSGRADSYVRPSNDNEFLEYQFTADNLDQFTGFAIKIVMSSANEAKPVEFRDLRVIALA